MKERLQYSRLEIAPAVGAVVVVFFVWLLVALQPELMAKLGARINQLWFVDSMAVLAASDARVAGIDASKENPLDPFGRPHVYSDWWHGLAHLGLTREDNFGVGLAWVGILLFSVLYSIRVRNWKEAVWLAAIMTSPPFLLAVNRANNDLVIFGLIAVAGVGLAASGAGKNIVAVVALAVATGLKFYPIAGLPAFFVVRPRRKLLLVACLAVTVSGAVLFSVSGAMSRAAYEVPRSVHTLGGAVLLREVGVDGAAAVAVQLVVLSAAGWILWRFSLTTGLGGAADGVRPSLEVLGMCLLLACFISGISYAYRWIFVIWPAIWFWRRSCNPQATRKSRYVAGAACVLVGFCLWGDGLFCLVTNTLIKSETREIVVQRQLLWRVCTQPLVWLLFALIAGWLLQFAATTWKEIRSESQ